jgi:DNA-binding NtrC family response regulator
VDKQRSDAARPETSPADARVLLGGAATFRRAMERLCAVAELDATVLIEGETGTGKELAARAVHAMSRRTTQPFVVINCGAIPDTLMEAELFGHARGAFTDASQERAGLLRTASRGTICLDEIGSLSGRGQATLLRVLQDKSFRALGSPLEQRTDARFIALTNTPLWDLVRTASFRADLYFRLCVLSVNLPPLRERRDDILSLAEHFLSKHARPERQVRSISPAVRTLLTNYHWPGNVRQLEFAILRAAQLAPGTSVELEDIELPDLPKTDDGDGAQPNDDEMSFAEIKRRTIEAFERKYLTRLMERSRGNVTHAAQMAHKERRDIGKLLKKYQIQPKTFTR